MLLHTAGDPNDARPALRTAVAQVLPGVPLRQVARLGDLMAAQTAERRVIAYLVSQQTREIGIRMALGATRSRVVAGVFSHVGWLVATGLTVGGIAAWSLSTAAAGSCSASIRGTRARMRLR